MNLTSEPFFPWLFALPELLLGHECLGDCLEHPPKKRADASSLCWACLDVHCLYALSRLPGHEILLPNCLEWHCPPLSSCFEGQMSCCSCILRSQLPQ